MEKEFVPYEQALELKELGFDGYSFAFYQSDRLKQEKILSGTQKYMREEDCKAPTFSQAFRWFDDNTECSGYIVPSIKERHFDWLIIIDEGEQFECEEAYSSRLDAELACLKKLIKLVKTK